LNLLEQILRDKKREIERAKGARPQTELQARIRDIPKPIGFGQALKAGRFGIIAEIKKKSPSMGAMLPANVEEAVGAYRQSDIVKAVSILTDWEYFGMRIEDLERLKREIGKPALRKDFIIDEYQVFEARAFGADAILLMASVLAREELGRLFDCAANLGMDVLFECHSKSEIEAISQGAQLYGINSREFKASQNSVRYRGTRLIGKLKLFGRGGLKDFSTDLGVFKELIGYLPKSAIKVAESGLQPKAISEVRELGFDCALIGTSLLKSSVGVTRTLESFRNALQESVLIK